MNHHPMQRLGVLGLVKLPGLSRIRHYLSSHTYILYPQIGLKKCAHPGCDKVEELGYIGPSEIKHLKKCNRRNGGSVHE